MAGDDPGPLRSPGHWDEPFHLGDWLDPAAPPDNAAAGRTAGDLVANAWFCHTAGLMVEVAELLGEDADAERFRDAEAAARADFATRYVHPDGTMTSDSQTAHALAIHFDLVDDDRRAATGRRLVELVEAEGHRIGTGFAGTPILCDALCAVGAVDTAYRLLLQTEAPSWLYPVLHGATTVWERWDGIRPDGTRNPGEMNSFNHYALGAVVDWLHRSVAGLAPAEPGYRRLLVQPLPGPGLDHATARHDTPYGRAEAGWRRTDGGRGGARRRPDGDHRDRGPPRRSARVRGRLGPPRVGRTVSGVSTAAVPRTRERILDVALDLFAEEGFSGTTITEVERRAGLSPGSGSFYRHFPSKEVLLTAAVEREVERLRAEIAAVQADTAAPARGPRGGAHRGPHPDPG